MMHKYTVTTSITLWFDETEHTTLGALTGYSDEEIQAMPAHRIKHRVGEAFDEWLANQLDAGYRIG